MEQTMTDMLTTRMGLIAALVAIDYVCVLLAVLADLRSGILKARRQGVKRTSRGLRRSVEKAGRYYVMLFAMTLIDAMVCGALLCVLRPTVRRSRRCRCSPLWAQWDWP